MAPLAARMGRSLRAETSSGLLLSLTTNSRSPMRAVPAGGVRVCWLVGRGASGGEGDVGGRDVFGVHQVGVGVDHDLAGLAAEGEGDGGAADGGEAGTDEAEA